MESLGYLCSCTGITNCTTGVRKSTQAATSFPGFSPTRPTERVGENPGNEVAQAVPSGTFSFKSS